jgi:hypothetical protein
MNHTMNLKGAHRAPSGVEITSVRNAHPMNYKVSQHTFDGKKSFWGLGRFI